MTGDSMYWRAWPIEEVDLAPFLPLRPVERIRALF